MALNCRAQQDAENSRKEHADRAEIPKQNHRQKGGKIKVSSLSKPELAQSDRLLGNQPMPQNEIYQQEKDQRDDF